MNLRHFGTQYGGWTIDFDSIKDGDVIIDAGLGEDLSFDIDILKEKNIKIIGVDPTIKSHIYVEKLNLPNLLLIKKAVHQENDISIKIYKNNNPEWVSESSNPEHNNVSTENFYEVDTVSLDFLIKKYQPSLVKLDIEGTEYDVLKQCVGVKQICVEFHHIQLKNKNYQDTIDLIEFFKQNNYQVIHSTNNHQEVTFLLI